MKSSSRGKETWVLTHESFVKLLAALDPDPERAGERYEQLRLKLLSLFKWRGSSTPDELADETLNRLARKIDEAEDIRNLSNYAGGIARLVWLEALKRKEREQIAFEKFDAAGQNPSPADTLRGECFEACLESLPTESRALILDYYREVKGAKIELRKQLAEKLGMPLTTLRNRAHRIRAQLQGCIADCVRKSE